MPIIANIELLIYSTLLFTPPLLIAGLACNLTTASGITNIGLDGLMTVGAFFGCASTYLIKNPFIGLLIAGISSTFFSIIFALFVLKLKTNEILVGFALNILMPALVIIVSYAIYNSTDTYALPSNLKIPILFKNLAKSDNQFIRFLSNIFSTYATTYFSFILVFISSFIIYKTSFGLKIRACGANKIAAVYVGLDKTKLQFYCILVSGFLYGISGAIYTMAITNQFRTVSICGQGYIALASVLFSDSNPILIMIYCIVFGFFSGLKTLVTGDSASVHLIQTLPYVATILILILKSHRPK